MIYICILDPPYFAPFDDMPLFHLGCQALLIYSLPAYFMHIGRAYVKSVLLIRSIILDAPLQSSYTLSARHGGVLPLRSYYSYYPFLLLPSMHSVVELRDFLWLQVVP